MADRSACSKVDCAVLCNAILGTAARRSPCMVCEALRCALCYAVRHVCLHTHTPYEGTPICCR
eukprot:5045207-Pyramimonas_sp.AAC.1